MWGAWGLWTVPSRVVLSREKLRCSGTGRADTGEVVLIRRESSCRGASRADTGEVVLKQDGFHVSQSDGKLRGFDAAAGFE